MRRFSCSLSIAGLTLLLAGCASAGPGHQPDFPRYSLSATHTWQLNLPGGERFDASGLYLTTNGDLLTVSDRGPTVYRIHTAPGATTADLAPLENCFTPAQLVPLAVEKPGRYDVEGIAVDAGGRIYLCEEANRWILRFDPRSQRVERLNIDWSPVRRYFSRTDGNASFEGLALGGGKLFVANERQQGRIMVVDLTTLNVVDDFVVHSSVASLWGPQYSDLCWFRDELYVLMREDHVVLRVNPRSHAVLAEYDFRGVELSPENEYNRAYWFTGVMEGLAVDDHNIWLITDNNGLGRKQYPRDTRPTLFQCRRPDPT